MDSLFEAALNAAALRPEVCERHPDRDGQLAIDLPSLGIKRYWCTECCDAYPSKGFGRAYATGTSAEAHAEAQEAGRLQQEYDEAKPHSENRRYL